MAVKHLRTAVRSASAPIHGNSRRIRAVAPRILDAEWSRPCGCRRCNYAWRRTKAFKRFWLSNWQYLTISHKREEVVWDRDQFNNHFASERRAAPCCDAANWLGLFRQIAWLPCDGLAGPPYGG